ncbi:hypothetical protein BWQ96_02448 [Gracilariopsis chorda]|uniref:Uncharacterized protein n=1 Tax=Gracilariopsis chorda TaxID=448386 RepID=A0A2V3J024_9FLOR|nr:hypothetical protein BWQ96_02448 [Gracilariopsis chorda]|eukprot:PXF47766.1 hypothetical protein BWQ96_02448 [Gracilariopsis chorda]
MNIGRLTTVGLRAATAAGLRRQITRDVVNGNVTRLTALLQSRYCAAQPAPSRPPRTNDNPQSESTSQAKLSPQPETRTDKDSSIDKPAETATEPAAKIPDIPSNSWTSIGFEPQDENDPHKWKKFAWKYAGAVLVFFISYKTLHWYVDRIEEEGKQQKKGMEEAREFSDEMKKQGSSPLGASILPDGSKELRRDEQHADLLKMLDTAKENEIQTSSELDELYRYRGELEEKLRDLRKRGRTPEIDAEKKEVKLDLKELTKDIHALEAKKKS